MDEAKRAANCAKMAKLRAMRKPKTSTSTLTETTTVNPTPTASVVAAESAVVVPQSKENIVMTIRKIRKNKKAITGGSVDVMSAAPKLEKMKRVYKRKLQVIPTVAAPSAEEVEGNGLGRDALGAIGGIMGTAGGGTFGTAVAPGLGTTMGATVGGIAGKAGGNWLADQLGWGLIEHHHFHHIVQHE